MYLITVWDDETHFHELWQLTQNIIFIKHKDKITGNLTADIYQKIE